MGRSYERRTLDIFPEGRHSEISWSWERNEDEVHDDEGLEGFALVSLATNGSDVRTAAIDPISIISPNSWQKGKLLGRGSFGSVYEGITDDGFFFAIKEVSLLDQGSEGRQSIEQEIALLSQFEHENIVQYYGTEKDESHLYIFIELVTKGSLLSLYQKHALREQAVSYYTKQILHGLKYLHNQDVVHRDIKCANILVDTDDVVKLADFGLAKATKLNDVKSFKGTAFWMAPEVVRSQGGYGVSADIWSLGCTVLEMLTRRFPYGNLEWMQALFKIGRGERPEIPDSLSKVAQDFILKCLQVDPSSRSTATELLDHPFVKRPLKYAAQDPISIISPNSWQKGEVLGRGSFASVYEGITDGGFFFAIKEVSLLDQGSEGRQSITQLEQEIALLGQFGHENIVQYYGAEKDQSHLYIFIELVTKGSLLSLYRKYTLQEQAVSSYTRQILHGLKYLHNQGVVHRDIKCANILVDTNGVVKLADFGLAKAKKLNDVKSCKGTAFWMAPEVVRSQGGYGVSADIWSLGCTVLEMLTGRFPYGNLEWMQALFKIGRGERPEIPDSLSKVAQDFILKCLQVNPSSRSTATQLLDHPFVKRPL